MESLNSIIDEVCFEKARCIVERTYNIIKSSKAGIKAVRPAAFKEPQEESLHNRYKGIRKEFEGLCQNSEYETATRLYGESLSEEVHEFFDKVMVNVENASLKNNRIALLSEINSLYTENIADLAKIVVERT